MQKGRREGCGQGSRTGAGESPPHFAWEADMKRIRIPHWFFQQLSDTTLLGIRVIEVMQMDVEVEADEETTRMWRRQLRRRVR